MWITHIINPILLHNFKIWLQIYKPKQMNNLFLFCTRRHYFYFMKQYGLSSHANQIKFHSLLKLNTLLMCESNTFKLFYFFTVHQTQQYFQYFINQDNSKMSITNLNTKQQSFIKALNRNTISKKTSIDPEKSFHLSLQMQTKIGGILTKFCQGEETKKIKVRTAATFSSQNQNNDLAFDINNHQSPSTDRVFTSENPFLRARASYLEKMKCHKKMSMSEFVGICNEEQKSDDVITFRELRTKRNIKNETNILSP